MPIDAEQVFVGLPSDPHAASYELLQRINAYLKSKVTPTNEDYTAVNSFFQAFFEAHNWKTPNRPTMDRSASDGLDEIARKMRTGQRLQYETFADQIMHNLKANNRRIAKEATDRFFAFASELGF